VQLTVVVTIILTVRWWSSAR